MQNWFWRIITKSNARVEFMFSLQHFSNVCIILLLSIQSLMLRSDMQGLHFYIPLCRRGQLFISVSNSLYSHNKDNTPDSFFVIIKARHYCSNTPRKKLSQLTCGKTRVSAYYCDYRVCQKGRDLMVFFNTWTPLITVGYIS